MEPTEFTPVRPLWNNYDHSIMLSNNTIVMTVIPWTPVINENDLML